MKETDYNLDHYTDEEIYRLFNIETKQNDMENLKNIDTYMIQFLNTPHTEELKRFLQSAGIRMLKQYIKRIDNMSIQTIMSIFNLVYPVTNIKNTQDNAVQIVDKQEGFMKLYFKTVFCIPLDL